MNSPVLLLCALLVSLVLARPTDDDTEGPPLIRAVRSPEPQRGFGGGFGGGFGRGRGRGFGGGFGRGFGGPRFGGGFPPPPPPFFRRRPYYGRPRYYGPGYGGGGSASFAIAVAGSTSIGK